jgi:hypothetical protein
MPNLTGDRPNADTQGESNPGIEREMGNNGNSMDPDPTEPEYGNFPMDSTTRTEEGDHPAPSPLCNRAFDRSPNPSLLEVTDPPKEMDDVCQQTAVAEEGPLPDKGYDTQSHKTLCHPLSPNQPSVRDDYMTDDVEASTPQHDIFKPEDPLANPKRPKKMGYDRSPHPPQKWTRSMTRRVSTQGWERIGVHHTVPPFYPTSQTTKRKMTVITKLANININGITNRTRVGVLTEYIRRHDLDIVFLQEIIDPEILHMSG